MKQRRLVLASLLLFSLISIAQRDTHKHVIGAWDGGLFAALLVTCNHLAWCEFNNKVPVAYWGKESLYYKKGGFNGSKNVWEYYFEPLSGLRYKKGDEIFYYYAMTGPGNPNFHYMDLSPKTRQAMRILIAKYIVIKPIIQQKIDAFYRMHMQGKKTIGIHLRGTDKFKEVKRVTPEQIARVALQHADLDTQFLVASDEELIIDQLKALLKPHKVIAYECYRSYDSRPIHYYYKNCAQAGEDVLVEVSLLAKCDMLVHSLSNVSSFVLYFNSDMPHELVRND